MGLPLVLPFGGGGHIYHDWNYMLSELRILTWDHSIAFFFRTCGVVSMGICLLAGAWMLWLMLVGKPNELTA